MRKFLLMVCLGVMCAEASAAGDWGPCSGGGGFGSATAVCKSLVSESYDYSHTEVIDNSTSSCYGKYKGGSGSPDIIGSACKVVGADKPAEGADPFASKLEKVREKLPGWKEQPNSKKTGSRFQDPADKGNRVRVDKGDPNHNLPRQQVDHVVEQKGGKTIDVNGQEIKPTPSAPKPTHTPEAHIPLDEWLKMR